MRRRLLLMCFPLSAKEEDRGRVLIAGAGVTDRSAMLDGNSPFSESWRRSFFGLESRCNCEVPLPDRRRLSHPVESDRWVCPVVPVDHVGRMGCCAIMHQ